jgi:TPR repeat protein
MRRQKGQNRLVMNKHWLVLAVRLGMFLLVPVATAHADVTAEREFQAQLDQAMHGNTNSQYRIGEMYELGIGTRKDTAMAYLWYNKAATQGNVSAKQKLETMDNSRSDTLQEQTRVEAAMRALQQQSEREANRQREKDRTIAEAHAREKAAAAEAAAAALARQRAAAPRARPPAASSVQVSAPVAAAPSSAKSVNAESAATKTVVPGPVKSTSAETAAAKPVEKSKEPEKVEFSTNPCKGPQAKFLSTCN